MKEEMKSKYLEKKFEEYNDGVSLPETDLTAAKAAVRNRRRRRTTWIAAASSLAACLIAAVVILPFALHGNLMGNENKLDPDAEDIRFYSLEETEQTAFSYSGLLERYPVYAKPLARLTFAKNAAAEYFLLKSESENVMLRVDFSILSGLSGARGTLWLDLTDGKRDAAEFSDYRELNYSYHGISYETDYKNAEYVSKAETTLEGALLRVDFVSSGSDMFFAFLEDLR